MLGGKAGLMHCHMGPGKALLGPLREAIEASCGDVPITQVHGDTPPQRHTGRGGVSSWEVTRGCVCMCVCVSVCACVRRVILAVVPSTAGSTPRSQGCV